jgi:hypothetical protein
MSEIQLSDDFEAAFLAALAVSPTAGQSTAIETLADSFAAAIFDNVTSPMTVTLNYPDASALSYEVSAWPVPASLDLAGATLTNVATVIYYKNGSAVTGTTVVGEGDKVRVDITKTTAAAASVVLAFVLTGGNITRTTADYVRPNGWTDTQNITLQPALFRFRGDSFISDYITGVDYNRWAIGGNNEWTGAKIIEFKPGGPYTAFGINTETGGISAPTNQYTRFEFGFLVAFSLFTVRELGGSVAGTQSFTNSVGFWYKIDYGGSSSIRYYYSDDEKATWNLVHTSARTYNAATVCRVDIGIGLDGIQSPEVLIY